MVVHTDLDTRFWNSHKHYCTVVIMEKDLALAEGHEHYCTAVAMGRDLALVEGCSPFQCWLSHGVLLPPEWSLKDENET